MALTCQRQHPLGTVDPKDDRPGSRSPDRRQQRPGARPDIDDLLRTGEGQVFKKSFSNRLYRRAPEGVVRRCPLRVTAR